MEEAAKQPHWRAIEQATLATIARLCHDRKRFTLHFMQWRVTSNALIVVANDECGVIPQLRQALCEVACHASEPAPRYDFVHSTLARFRDHAKLEAGFVQALEAQSISLRAPVTSVEVVRERVYPSLEVDQIWGAALS